MALYAFDGTGNKDKRDDEKDTNVRKFFEAYVAGYKPRNQGTTGAAKGSQCVYIKGVGTGKLPVRKTAGLLFGAGGKRRISGAIEALEDNIRKGDAVIDIVGFSRGAAEALEFANRINEGNLVGKAARPIRFMGLWDTVASFGVPGNDVNLGFNLRVPENVKQCCHALALDERRFTFPLTRLVTNALSNREDQDLREVWFRGYHSDVGGGNKNEGLSSIALVWMFHRAKNDSKLNIPQASIDAHEKKADANASPKTPGMDRKSNSKRTILRSDVVHDSVFRREKSGRFAANNPPKGLSVTGDDGKIRRKGFEQ